MNELLSALARLMAEEGIEVYGSLPFDRVKIIKPHLLERCGFSPRGVLLFAVPYLFEEEQRNLSRYAASPDYHGYMKALEGRLRAAFSESPALSSVKHALFSDHSPIHERHAAALAGLGLLGKNGLLLTKEYGSYVFLGELLLDAPLPATGDGEVHSCADCGACFAACPTGALRGEGECLSALTQKKGELAPETVSLMQSTHSVWGCDLCQEVCPHNRSAAFTSLAYFRSERLPLLTEEHLLSMSEEAFARRAFSFRGREVILRNLRALLSKDPEKK